MTESIIGETGVNRTQWRNLPVGESLWVNVYLRNGRFWYGVLNDYETCLKFKRNSPFMRPLYRLKITKRA